MDETTTVASGVGIRKDSDYAYIWTFIEFLREIINIIKELFSGIDLSFLKDLMSSTSDDEATTA